MKRIKRGLMPALAHVAILLAAGVTSDNRHDGMRADLYAAGEAALEAEQWDEAIAHCQGMCDLDPDSQDAEEELAYALERSVVYVPAGEFLMGSDAGDLDERPQPRIYLDAFEIDRYEVTNVQYRRFLLTTGHDPPQRWPDRYVAFVPDRVPDWHGTDYPNGEAMHPVVSVNWEDAAARCAWVGKRLPTEAEWEKAARGAEGRTYALGDEWDAGKASVGQTGVGYT